MEKQQESRGVIYDHALEIEVYRLGGVAQTFPNHFHNDYVIGLMEQGRAACGAKTANTSCTREICCC